MNKSTIEIVAAIERKQPDLPRFAVIPSSAVRPWRLTETTAIDLAINSQPVERRTIRYWDENRWFISITATDCRRLNVGTGDKVTLTMRLASPELPVELADLLKESASARSAWERLTRNQQRMLRELIAAAKNSSTRTRRARKELLGD
jgi:hypothetical protein